MGFFWWFQFTRYLSNLYYCKYSRAQFYFNILVIVVQKECFNDCNKKNHTFRISLAGHHCSSIGNFDFTGDVWRLEFSRRSRAAVLQMYIHYTVFKHELDNTCKSLQSSFHISSKWPIVMESLQGIDTYCVYEMVWS